MIFDESCCLMMCSRCSRRWVGRTWTLCLASEV